MDLRVSSHSELPLMQDTRPISASVNRLNLLEGGLWGYRGIRQRIGAWRSGSHSIGRHASPMPRSDHSEDLWIAMKSPLPELMTQHEHGIRSGHTIFIAQKGAAKLRNDPERCDVICRHKLGLELFAIGRWRWSAVGNSCSHRCPV